jgi:hypothetical protein
MNGVWRNVNAVETTLLFLFAGNTLASRYPQDGAGVGEREGWAVWSKQGK